MEPRPAPIEVGEKLRRDIQSEDVRRVHPDLPMGSSAERREHLRRCDERAYRAIEATFPAMTPPGWQRRPA